MRREDEPISGYILLINLASASQPVGHLHLDQAMAMLPDLDLENLHMLFQSKWIQLSVLHPAVTSAVVASDFGERHLGPLILKMQDLFGCIVIYGPLADIDWAVPSLASVKSYLRKSVILASSEAESAMADLALALRVAASRVVDRVGMVEISVVVRGEKNRRA